MSGPRAKGLFPYHVLLIRLAVHPPATGALPFLRPVLYILRAAVSCEPRQAGQYSWGSELSMGIWSCNKEMGL